jgi:tRNA(Ile2) C34 agmatinyltransferase TiaS
MRFTTIPEEEYQEYQKLKAKATPKKIEMLRYKKYDGYNLGICDCGKTIDASLDDEIFYCPKCGQRIDLNIED